MLTPGLYEQIISQALSRELAGVSDACKYVEKLDAAEAPQALAGYVAEAVRYVHDLQPYALRKQWMLGGAGVITAAVGALCGMNTIGAIMRDGDFRGLLGKALTEEISVRFPDLEVECQRGGQPLYYYFISLE